MAFGCALASDTTAHGHARHDIRIKVGAAEIAATLHLPDVLDVETPLVCLYPGGGYSRGYFDLPREGYSEAAAHVAAGFAVVAFDHLGVGESTLPPPGGTGMFAVADANHTALRALLDSLAAGRQPAVPQPWTPKIVVGAGQSMGGFILLTMQARHRCFDGIISLGSSAVETDLPRRGRECEVLDSTDADAATRAAAAIAQLDWPWAFHWIEDKNDLVDLDIAAGLPGRTAKQPWVSMTMPELSTDLMMPGIVAREAALTDVPVMIAIGERDVCQPALVEAGAYRRSPDIAICRIERMAHMHNFAPTRERLWRRMNSFVRQIAAQG